jgi:hypothetical protein
MRLKGYKGCVVGVTGDVFPEEINNFKSHGADIVMVKPINIESLSEYLQGERTTHAYRFFVTYSKVFYVMYVFT